MKTAIFTEQNKVELDSMVEEMLGKCAGNAEWEKAINDFKAACLEHAGDCTITKSETLSSAISEVWLTYYSKKFVDRRVLFSQAFRAGIELAKISY